MTPIRSLLAYVAVLAAAGCSSQPVTQFNGAAEGRLSNAPYEQAKPVPFKARLYAVSPGLIAALRVEKPAQGDPGRLDVERRAYQYRLGVGDELRLSVWSPLRSLASFNAEPAPTEPSQGEPVRSRVIASMKPVPALSELVVQVQPDGQVQLPYLGAVKAAGLTRVQLAQSLEKQLAGLVAVPVIDLRVNAYRSQWVQLTGAVTRPGPIALDEQPMTLLEVLGRGGPFTAEADTRRVFLSRGGKRHVIGLPQLLQGDPLYNGVLQAGDVVHVPDVQEAKVFVLGEVSLKQRSVLPLKAGGLTLGEALATAGGLNPATAHARGVFVIRASRDEKQVVQVFQLDLENAASYVLADAFPLRSRDFVFVSPGKDADWRQIASELQPLLKGPDAAEVDIGIFQP